MNQPPKELIDAMNALEQARDKADRAAKEYADHVYPVRVYIDVVKYYLAAKIQELRQTDENLSETKLENLARADTVYKDNLETMVKRVKASEAARIKYDNAQNQLKAQITQTALIKSQIESFG